MQQDLDLRVKLVRDCLATCPLVYEEQAKLGLVSIYKEYQIGQVNKDKTIIEELTYWLSQVAKLLLQCGYKIAQHALEAENRAVIEFTRTWN